MKLVPGLLGALTALALAVPTLASAETTTLKFAMPGAAHDEHYERVLIPWAKKVEKESNRMIAIQFFVGPRLANFGNMIDRELLAMGLAATISSTFPAGAASRINLAVDILASRFGARDIDAIIRTVNNPVEWKTRS